MSVPVYYGWQGGQLLRMAGWANGKNFLALCAEFYQTNVCPLWPETLPAPLVQSHCTRCM